MAKKQFRRQTPSAPSPLDEARDELFQHIMSCGVIGAEPDDQASWFDETMRYFGERFPELKAQDLQQLRELGTRFAQPPKAAVAAASVA
jgi:hypothetical protein